MVRNPNPGVLVVGIDSAEHSLIWRMIEQDELPVLKSLLAAGKWIRLESPAAIGTSSVWPTFMTGEDPEVHGIYSEWCWEPATMSVRWLSEHDLQPFWEPLADAGNSIGILAVPFMPLVGLADGFEISESEPYVRLDNNPQARVTGLTDLVNAEAARKSLTNARVSVSGPEDFKNLQKLASGSHEGIKLRGKLAEQLLSRTKPDLSVIVFTETHESGHCLWQTVEPEDPLFQEDSLQKLRDVKPTLKTIYQEVDHQIGKLIDVVGKRATILVFALHGMSPARGVPTFLAPLMIEAGFSPISNRNSQSLSGRVARLAASVKRLTPARIKRLYYKSLPRSTVLKLATPTILPQYDWSRTRAFSLVTEQHGSIRINLVGREAEGIVPVAEYAEACREVEQWLHTLITIDGKPLAKRVIRMTESGEQALERRIPDVIVHWEDVAFRSPLRIKDSPIDFFPDGNRYLSQHTSEGFCILKSDCDTGVVEIMPIKDLGRLISGLVLKDTGRRVRQATGC